MMVHAYDYDGVLAVGPPKPPKPWRFMLGPARAAWRVFLLRHYAAAKPLLPPVANRPFYVITARKDSDEVRAVSEAWLERHYPGRCRGLFLLGTGRTLENVIAFKAATLTSIGATDFTEDNPQVVKGLRALNASGLKARIWLYKKGHCTLDAA